MKLHVESRAATAQDRERAMHPADRPRDLPAWRTVRELTEELRFPSPKACRAWLHRQGIASVKRGRVILVSRVDIDRTLRGIA